ncbi:nitrate- and nitrite sensing domain-containing protein [Actinomadura madurae]|nr:nitrate- and nitrite sensing domain-containing protein [Actinomadura madurae]MCP9983386.1 nitrate- and nitrite sensing domain-containing protein [Actinomadura madurae]
MELLQRENALVAAAFITKGRMSRAEHRMFTEMVGEQRQQWIKQRSLLDPVVYRTGTAQVFAAPAYQNFRAMEDRIADADPRRPIPVRPADWQRTAEPLVLSVNKMVLGNSQRAGEHADDLGRKAYIRLGVVGGLGLLAILASVLLSLRFARGFVRELVGLRGSAEEVADKRLPDVVRRLSRNETVDVAAEAPPLEPGAPPRSPGSPTRSPRCSGPRSTRPSGRPSCAPASAASSSTSPAATSRSCTAS